MAEVTLRIEGMHCGSCIRRVTQAIGSAGAVEVKEVRLGAARFVVGEGEVSQGSVTQVSPSQVSDARPGAPGSRPAPVAAYGTAGAGVAQAVIAALAKAGFKAEVEA